MDKILLKELSFYGNHGVLPEETRLGQRFNVSLTLETDLRPAGRSDDLNLTINYAEVAEVVRKHLEGQPCKLLECLAEKISADLFATFPSLERAIVAIDKPQPPIALPLQRVGIEIDRKRPA